jgi:hypothetical protein
VLRSGKYKSILNLEAKYDIFNEILSSFNRKMDFYFTTSPSSFLCFQVTWYIVSLSKYSINCQTEQVVLVRSTLPSFSYVQQIFYDKSWQSLNFLPADSYQQQYIANQLCPRTQIALSNFLWLCHFFQRQAHLFKS